MATIKELEVQIEEAQAQLRAAKEAAKAAKLARKALSESSAIANVFVTFPRERHAEMLGETVEVTIKVRGTFGVTSSGNVGFAQKVHVALADMVRLTQRGAALADMVSEGEEPA